MFVEAIIIGFIVGHIRNGNLDNLRYINIRGISLIVFAGIIQAVPLLLSHFAVFTNILSWFTPISLIILILCLVMNFQMSGVWIITLGASLNLLVLLINKMCMPVLFQSLKIAGMQDMIDPISMGEVINYISFDKAWLISGYLGKIIPIPSFYPLAKVLSIGDVFIMWGIIVWIATSMRKYRFRRML